jgi:glycosyltransferase involved in cell wall biosynthesis
LSLDGGNICVLVSQLGYGGAERQTTLLLEQLAREHGVRPLVCCMSPVVEPFGSRIQAAGCELIHWTRGKSYELRRVLFLRRLLKERGIQLVHAVHYDAIAYGWMAKLGLREIAFVPSVRSTMHAPVLRKRVFYRFVLPRCSVVIANSHSGKQWLEQFYGVPSERIHVVPNGLDPRLLSAAPDRAAVRVRLGVPLQAPLLAFVGKNVRHKGIPLLFRIFRRLLEARSDAHLIMMGEGLTEDWVQSSFGGHSSVHGLGPRNDVYDLLGAADCLALTSTSEGFPNAVLEAMVLGVPPVTTSVGECPILIDHGVNGFLFDGEDDAEAARLLLTLLEDSAKREAFSRSARAKVLQRYGSQTMVTETLQVYEQALGRKLNTMPAVPELT